jgi:hypothetical protein
MSEREQPVTAASIEERLDELQRQSEERRQELSEIAAQLPGAVSRRQLLRAIVVDIRRAPRKRDIAGRALSKAARTPGEVSRSLAHRLRRRP